MVFILTVGSLNTHFSCIENKQLVTFSSLQNEAFCLIDGSKNGSCVCTIKDGKTYAKEYAMVERKELLKVVASSNLNAGTGKPLRISSEYFECTFIIV